MATEVTNITGAPAVIDTGVNNTPPVPAPMPSSLPADVIESLAKDDIAEAAASEPDPILDEHLENFIQGSPVSRAEFEELVDAFLRLATRIDKFNQGSPHKI